MIDEATRTAALLRRIGDDPSASIELLSIATKYLKARHPLPDELADYLAKAFRYAVATSESEDGKSVERERVSRLAFALGMTRNEGRPRKPTPDGEIAATIATFGATASETDMKKTLKATFDLSGNTARARIRTAKGKIAEAKKRLNIG